KNSFYVGNGMKHGFFIVCGFLSGCSSLNPDMVPGGNMLDTAPKTNTEMSHPEWGYARAAHVSTARRVNEKARAAERQ
ncbi:OmpA family protein, partial [Vibrio parahaemolyticus]|nr:OmpA family protein [Vibrio parahaemolyticus]